jgi:hypothetical protein
MHTAHNFVVSHPDRLWNILGCGILKSFPTQRSIRSPGPVTPRDIECEGFDLTYTRIASDHITRKQTPSSYSPMENDVDKKVDDAIESFLRSLSQIGPELLSVRRRKFEHHHRSI